MANPLRAEVTCCYCGSRAALVLTGAVRHELSCASCGAPLRSLKNLKAGPDRAVGKPSKTGAPPRKARRKGKRRVRWSRIWDGLEDVVEEIFD